MGLSIDVAGANPLLALAQCVSLIQQYRNIDLCRQKLHSGH